MKASTFADKQLLKAAQKGNLKSVKEALLGFGFQQQADIEAKDKTGRTALGQAVFFKNKEIARYLIEHGADIEAKDNNGRTPLMTAIKANFQEIAQDLIEYGADIEAQDRFGITPLMVAATHKDIEMARLLIRHGADVNKTDHNGNTPLINAAWYGNQEIIQYLIEQGADVNAQDQYGNTALMRTAYFGLPKTLIYLIRQGAEVKIMNKWGHTALDYAYMTEQNEIVRILEPISEKKHHQSNHSFINTSNPPHDIPTPPNSILLQKFILLGQLIGTYFKGLFNTADKTKINHSNNGIIKNKRCSVSSNQRERI